MAALKNSKIKNKGKNPGNPGHGRCQNDPRKAGLLEEWIASLKKKHKRLV